MKQERTSVARDGALYLRLLGGVVISIRVVVESLGRRQQCFDDGELS